MIANEQILGQVDFMPLDDGSGNYEAIIERVIYKDGEIAEWLEVGRITVEPDDGRAMMAQVFRQAAQLVGGVGGARHSGANCIRFHLLA